MPHSSGGGFHGGGYHGGSHGSFSSGSGSSTNKSYSRVRFTGARTFCYYKNNQINYVYSNKDLTKKGPSVSVPLAIRIFMVISLIVIILVSLWISMPKPKYPSSLLKSNRILIEDDVDIFTDKEEKALKDTLSKFYDETGIPVGVCTIHHGQANSTLSNYAYNRYLDTYRDEGHWLLVISVRNDDTDPHGMTPKWKFEGMQGNNTDYILSSDRTLLFNKTLYNYLNNTKMSYANCLMKTFDEFTPIAMDSEISRPSEDTFPIFVSILISLALVELTFFIIFFKEFMMIFSGVKFYEISATERKITCKECGHEYIENTHLKWCPHCNNTNSRFSFFHRDSDEIE